MFNRIQYRIVFIVFISILFFILITGFIINWTIKQSLENTLGEKLSIVAQSCTALLDSSEVNYLKENYGPRLKNRIELRLDPIYKLVGIKRIFLFDSEDQILIDLFDHSIGIPGPDLYFFQQEIDELKNNSISHSVLYQGIDRSPSMSGFAAIFDKDKLILGVGVEGNANFLDDVQKIQHQLLFIGMTAILLSIIIGIFLSNTITKPIRLLSSHSKYISTGNYENPIFLKNQDEVGDLSKTMEEMRQNILSRENELKMMLSGVAHEIRNPLGGMVLFTDLLEEEVSKTSTAYNHVQRIQKEIHHLQKIVHRFLDFARPAKPDLQKVILVQTIKECIDLNQDLIELHQIKIIQDIKSDVYIYVDPNHMKEIILNILQNALDATPEKGEIKIRVKTEDPVVNLEISDSGKGIDKQHHDKIFNPFYTTRSEGTGLGLSIAKSLVKSNGGDIVLEKSDESGTIFHVYLRLWKDAPLST